MEISKTTFEQGLDIAETIPSSLAEQPLTSKQKPKLLVLEAIRGLAALSVVNWHFVELFCLNEFRGQHIRPGFEKIANCFSWIDCTPLRLCFDGEFAVRVFFVLSGIVLSIGVLTKKSVAPIQESVLKRLPRLMIPATVAIAITCMALKMNMSYLPAFVESMQSSGLDVERAHADIYPNPSWFGAFKESIRVFAIGTPDQSFNRVLWTMKIELMGSMTVFAFLAIFYNHRNLPYFALGFALILFALGQFYFADFIVGILVSYFLLTRENTTFRLSEITWIATCTAGWMLAALPSVWVAEQFGNHLASLKITSAAVAIIIGASQSQRLSQCFGVSPLAWLGKVSFAIYLLHLLAFWVVGMPVYLLLMGTAQVTVPVICAYIASITVLAIAGNVFATFVDGGAIFASKKLARFLLGKS